MYNEQTFQQLFKDPRFQKLTYRSQQMVRDQLFKDQTASDPRWASLSTGARQKVYDQVVTKALPAFENPGFTRLVTDPGANLVFNFMAPFASNGIVMKGQAWFASRLDGLAKKLGLMDPATISPYEAFYSKDSVKATQFVSETKGNPGMVQPMATIGDIWDWVAMGMLTRSSSGIGVGAKVGRFLGKAAAGDVAGGAGKVIGRWVATGNAGVLGVELGTKTFANTAFNAAARNYIVTQLGAQAVRSVGAGVLGVEKELLQKQLTEGKIPWAPGIELTAKEVGKTFGQYAAFDFLLNTAKNAIWPWLRLTGRALTGKNTPKASGLDEVAGYTPRQQLDYVRQIKLGVMDEAVWKGMPQSVQDHLTALAALDQNAARGAAIFEDPVATIKTVGFLVQHDVVDAAEAGTFRIRTSPGTGSLLVADGVRLPEAARVIAENFGEMRKAALQQAEDLFEKVGKLKGEVEGLAGGAAEDAPKLAQAKANYAEATRHLEGTLSTLRAYNVYEPYLMPVLDSVERAKGSFEVGKAEGSMSPSERSMITYDEAARTQANPLVKTLRFNVDLPKNYLSGKEASFTGEVSIGKQGPAPQVDRYVKDFFIKQADPFRVRASSDNWNGLLTYSRPANDKIFAMTVEKMKGVASKATAEELAQSRLLALGFDSIEHADGSVTALLPRVQIKHVSERVNVNKGLYTAGVDVGRPAGKLRESGKLSPRFLSSIGKDVLIKQVLKLGVSDKQLSESSKAMVTMLRSVYGDVKGQTVKRIAEIYMKRNGDPATDLSVKVVDGLKPKEMSFEMVGGKRVLTVPARITSSEDQIDFITQLGEMLGRKHMEKALDPFTREVARQVLESTKGAGPIAEKELREAFEGQVEATLSAELPYTEIRLDRERVKAGSISQNPLPDATDPVKMQWLNDQVMKAKNAQLVVSTEGVQQGFTEIRYANGRTFRSNIADDLVDDFLTESASEQLVRAELAEEGIKLYRTNIEGKFYRAVQGKTELGSGETIGELLRQMNWRPSKIDSVFAPTEVEIGPKGVEFRVEGNYAIGSINEAVKFLNKFADPAEAATTRVISKTAVGKLKLKKNESWVVDIPSWGIHREFHGAGARGEAHTYLHGEYQTWTEVEKLANSRGMIARVERGQYKLVDETGTYWAKTKDDVGKILAKRPDLSFAPNLTPWMSEEATEKFLQNWKAGYEPQTWALPADFTAKVLTTQNVSKFVRPMHDWIVDYARSSGHHRLAELYSNLDRADREALRQINDARRLFHVYLSEPGTHNLFPEEKLRGMKNWMEAVDEESRKLIQTEYGLEQKHLDSAEKLRDILGTDIRTNPGLFGKHGIDSNRFLFGYLPQIREQALKLGKGPKDILKMTDADVEAFAEGIWGKGNLPKELSFFAENKRLAEVVDFAREQNVANLLLRYSDRMHKKLFLNDIWKEIDNYTRTNPNAIDTVAVDRMTRYREMVMGTYTDDATKAVKAFGRGLMAKLGAKNAETGSHLAEMLFTLNTMTTQAFRYWLTVRNMTQIWTTTGALLGNSWVEEGIQRVVKDPDGVIGVMRARGSITEAPPLLNEIAYGNTKLSRAVGNVTEVGMRAAKRSDDLTRAPAYAAAEAKWEWAENLKRKNPSFKFEEELGLNLIHDEVAAQVGAWLKEGTPEALAAAKHAWADDVTRLTMFDYTRPNSPQLYHGFLGRMFGQYQIYPAYYAALVKRMMTKGTGLQRAGMLARLAGNAAAIAGSLNAIGIDGKNMLPWVPAQMTGGPLFNLGLLMMQATDTTSYRGRQARGELAGTLLNMTPGNYEYKMLSGFLKYLEAGEPLLALYAISSAPIRPDLRR